MAKTDFTTGTGGQSVHGRTTAGADATQAVVLALDGSDSVIPGSATFGISTDAGGTYAYAAGTGDATVDVPAAARLKRVSVIANASTVTTVTIGGGNTISIPAGASFDEQIQGAAVGADVVIGAGDSQSYYVAWTV